jgi:hypothetical protein
MSTVTIGIDIAKNVSQLHRVDAFGPTCSASKAQPPNQRPLVVVLAHLSLRCALHHGETRLCISLPFSISFIANIARKRPELNNYRLAPVGSWI